ncbi:hypothetical protein ABPG74_005200 [Tetrahymena malaccensis]
MKSFLKLKFLILIQILSTSLIHAAALNQSNNQESQPQVIVQSSLSLDRSLSYYTISIDLATLKGYQTSGLQYQDEKQIINNGLSSYFEGSLALEFIIDSEKEFKVFLYTTNQQNATSLRHFKNIQGYNFLKTNRYSSQQLEIILEKILEKNTDTDDIYEDGEDQKVGIQVESKNKQSHDMLNYTLKIININQTQNYCPYNCFGNGECQRDGTCQCDEGFSPEFNCMIQLQYFKVDIEKVTNLQINGIQENLNANQLIQQYNSNLIDLNYAKLEIEKIEDLKNQVLYKQQFYGIPNEILITFTYTKNFTENQPAIRILDNHNFFKTLETEEILYGNRYASTFQLINIDYYQLFMDENTQGQLLTFAYKSSLDSIEIEIQVLYDDIKLIYESIQMLLITLLSILILVFLAISLKKGNNQDSQMRQLSMRQINQLTYLKRSNQTNLDIQYIMNNQLISYFYRVSSQKNLENATHTECYICLNTYEEQEELCKTKCGHVFHKNCLQAWISQNQVCPIDRNCIFDGKPITNEIKSY